MGGIATRVMTRVLPSPLRGYGMQGGREKEGARSNATAPPSP
jgi:hypothetical protein